MESSLGPGQVHRTAQVYLPQKYFPCRVFLWFFPSCMIESNTISYPETTGFLVSGRSPVETSPWIKKPVDSGYEIGQLKKSSRF